MAKSNFSKVDEYGFERSEDFDYDTYESFMSSYLTVLVRRAQKWSQLLDGDKPIVRSTQVKRYVRKGIPGEHRGNVWLQVSGIYEEMNEVGALFYTELLSSDLDSSIVEAVRTDLPRTFPDNILFGGSAHQQQLYRILVAYAHHNKRVGYCQGLNYIAGLLLLVTKSEEKAFWLLKVLVERILPDYYGPTMEGVIVDIEVFSELVRVCYCQLNLRDSYFHFICSEIIHCCQTNLHLCRLKQPEIHKHITDNNIPWALIATKWFVCLFAEVLPVETVLRIWDCLFYEGSKIMFRVCLTLVGLHKDELLASEDFASLANCFKSITKDPTATHCHSFMKNVFKKPGSLSQATIEKLRRKIAQERSESTQER